MNISSAEQCHRVSQHAAAKRRAELRDAVCVAGLHETPGDDGVAFQAATRRLFPELHTRIEFTKGAAVARRPERRTNQAQITGLHLTWRPQRDG